MHSLNLAWIQDTTFIKHQLQVRKRFCNYSEIFNNFVFVELYFEICFRSKNQKRTLWKMKSNQLMSIPFNGRAHFDQIDFVKCNRVRERDTNVHICSFNKWPQIFAGSANIQLPRTLHWARTQCEFGKSVYYFLVNRFDSICRHAVRDQSRTFVGKDWSAKIHIHTAHIFNPFHSHCAATNQCKCSTKMTKRVLSCSPTHWNVPIKINDQLGNKRQK